MLSFPLTHLRQPFSRRPIRPLQSISTHSNLDCRRHRHRARRASLETKIPQNIIIYIRYIVTYEWFCLPFVLNQPVASLELRLRPTTTSSPSPHAREAQVLAQHIHHTHSTQATAQQRRLQIGSWLSDKVIIGLIFVYLCLLVLLEFL